MSYKATDRYQDRAVLGVEVRRYREGPPGVTLCMRPGGGIEIETYLAGPDAGGGTELRFDGPQTLEVLADDLKSLAKELRNQCGTK